jgi:predicted RNA methylase
MWFRRVSKSLRRRGAVLSADRALSMVAERWFDFRYGTDTVTEATFKALTIDSPNEALGVDYSPTRIRPFRRVMSRLVLPSDSAFVDFGSGKGRVLLMAAAYGFKRITGVEFARELCHIARQNVERYRGKTGIETDIRIVEADAVDYEIQDDDNCFFMNNPFEAAVMKKVVRNIAASLAKRARRILIVYNNPHWCHAIIVEQGFLPVLTLDADDYTVYSNMKDA